MRFVPYQELGATPNIIVDGAALNSTVLTLSHWPKSGTLAALKRDTSAEIAFAYLDSPAFHVSAQAVSNNHFDEDGLMGVFALVQPAMAQQHRGLLIDAAEAGDFGRYRQREAARIALTVAAYADPELSPLPRQIFELPYMQMAARLYEHLLETVPSLLTNLDDYKEYWHDEDERLATSEKLLAEGTIRIEERPELDLAVVHIPENLTEAAVHRFTGKQLASCHPFAIHNRTNCFRLLLIQGRHVEFQYRYESWVQYVSRRPAPRVDLTGLATELNQEETSGGQWKFDGVDSITPKLRLERSAASSIPAASILARLEQHLRTGAPAWNPYD
jgi:hypothetical protein